MIEQMLEMMLKKPFKFELFLQKSLVQHQHIQEYRNKKKSRQSHGFFATLSFKRQKLVHI